MCLFVCFLFVHHLWTVVAPDINVMYVHHHDEIKVLDLWNLQNLYCGEWDDHQAYRNDYIDHVDLECIEKLTVRIFDKEDNQLVLEYFDITTKKLEDYIRRKPDSAAADRWEGTRVPLPTDQYLVNEENYEFRWLNQNGDKIFAAFYYDSSADEFPIFYFSEGEEGADHTRPDEDNDSGMIESHEIRVSFTVQNIDQCQEANVPHSIFLDECPDFKPPTVTSILISYTEDIGTNITLNCQHAKNNDPVTEVKWFFQNMFHKSLGVHNVINTDVAKYSGSTVDSPSLMIYNIMPDDIGEYSCRAFTDYSSKPGSGPLISVMLKEAAPVFQESISQYVFEVGDEIQLPCSYEAFPLATDVKWMKDSNIVTNCFSTGSADIHAGEEPVLSNQAVSITSTSCQGVISILNPDLVISNAEMSDSGTYKCCVTNTISEHCGNDIIVRYPSVTTTTTQNFEATTFLTTTTSTQNAGTTSAVTTTTTTQNPATTSLLTTITSTQNAGTRSAVTTSSTTQNPETTSVSTMLTTPTTTTQPKAISCQCPCSSLGEEARQDFSNFTIDELFEMLAPQLAKMEKELSVDKSNLSATVNKRISAKDERKSSQSIGILGIVFIVTVILSVVIIDLMSLIDFLKPKLKRGKTDTSEAEERQD